MKVKMIKDFKIGSSWVRKNEILKVRLLRKVPFDFNPLVQVIEGTYSGGILSREYFIEVPEEKTYTEKEWNDMENYYMDLLEKERQKVSELQDAKNNFLNEFESFIKQLAVARQVSGMLNEWLNASYDGDEKNDRDIFSIELTKFIQGKLV